MATLTVPQLAEACAPLDGEGNLDGDRLRLWIWRLRHWTVLGILPPAAKHGSDLVYIAAILLRLAGPGLPASLIKSISTELQEKISRRRTNFAKWWREARSVPQPNAVYFYLMIRIAKEGTVTSVGISRTQVSRSPFFGDYDPGIDTALVVNLTEVFRVMHAQM